MGGDLIVVSCAWLLAYQLRFRMDLVPVEKGVPPIENYLSVLVIVWVIYGLVFRHLGLYRAMRGVRRVHELWLLIRANAFAILLFIAAIYLFKEKTDPFSRLVFLYFWGFSTLFTIVERSVLRFCLREIRRKGFNLRYLLIVGAERVAEDVIQRVRDHRELGIQLLGCLSKRGDEVRGPCGLPVVGRYEDLKRCLARMDIDQLVVALPLEDNHMLPFVMEQIGDSLVDVKIVPDLYQFVSLCGSIEEFEGLPVISVQTTPLEGVGLIVKRTIDLGVAIPLSVLFAPLMILIALLVKLTSRGPIFFKQERVSYDGTPFSILKFRTMYSNAEEKGPGWTRPNDNRVTPLGKFLRSTSLDELPQIFNVIRGDMSIVGPRPERPVYIEEFRRRIPRYMLRHKVPAGMTGWAQVNGWRGDTSIDKRIEYDLYYIENWSLFLDFKILFMTVYKGFTNRNAY